MTVTIPIRSPTVHRGQVTTSRGKFHFVTLCLVVLCSLCLMVANRVFNSSFGHHGETKTAAAAGGSKSAMEASLSTRLAESSIRSGGYDGDSDDDEDDVGSDTGGGGAGQTMRTQLGQEGHEGSNDAPTTTATDAYEDFKLAASQSFGFFYDVSADSWNLLRDIYLKHDNHRDPSRPLLYSEHDPKSNKPWDMNAAAWYQNNYEPNISCMFEKRIGGMQMNGDGPKWVCIHWQHHVYVLSYRFCSACSLFVGMRSP
jgi:hypothetical protein